jgi:hypothetical protein
MSDQRAKVAELLRLYREFSCRVQRDQLRNLLTEAYGSEHAEESLKEFHLPAVTENEIDAAMKHLNMAVSEIGLMISTLRQLNRPEPEESDLTPNPDQSTWRTRPGLF